MQTHKLHDALKEFLTKTPNQNKLYQRMEVTCLRFIKENENNISEQVPRIMQRCPFTATCVQ